MILRKFFNICPRETVIIKVNQRDRFSVALYATEERSPEDEKLYAGQNRGGKKK